MIYITTENKTSQEIDDNTAKVEEHFREFSIKGNILLGIIMIPIVVVGTSTIAYYGANWLLSMIL